MKYYNLQDWRDVPTHYTIRIHFFIYKARVAVLDFSDTIIYFRIEKTLVKNKKNR